MCIGGMHRSIIDVGSMKGHQHLEAEFRSKNLVSISSLAD